jgi:hypothetical protein
MESKLCSLHRRTADNEFIPLKPRERLRDAKVYFRPGEHWRGGRVDSMSNPTIVTLTGHGEKSTHMGNPLYLYVGRQLPVEEDGEHLRVRVPTEHEGQPVRM